MILLNGKELSEKLKNNYKHTVAEMNDMGICVSLAVIQIGNNSASSVYVKNKEKVCAQVGVQSMLYKLEENTAESELIELIESLNDDEDVNGILVQLPLPRHINKDNIINAIAPEKDVDGFHLMNAGKLLYGKPEFVPCTALGIIKLLQEYEIEIEGKHCVVIGRSEIVGKPIATELLRHNATVTVCHSKTNPEELKRLCRYADIIVCASGKPKLINRDFLSEKSVVVDVGIHRLEDGSMCGDVDFEDVKDVVTAITPVPGGVGAMTVAMLVSNCIDAAKLQQNYHPVRTDSKIQHKRVFAQLS